MMIIIYTDGRERTVPLESAERTCGLDHRWHDGNWISDGKAISRAGLCGPHHWREPGDAGGRAPKSTERDHRAAGRRPGPLRDAAHVASEIEQRFSRLDVAFLNAGVGRMLPIEATDEPTFDEHFAVNVK